MGNARAIRSTRPVSPSVTESRLSVQLNQCKFWMHHSDNTPPALLRLPATPGQNESTSSTRPPTKIQERKSVQTPHSGGRKELLIRGSPNFVITGGSVFAPVGPPFFPTRNHGGGLRT